MTPAKGRSLLWRLGVALVAVQAIAAVILGAYGSARVRADHREQTVIALSRLTPLAADRLTDDLLRTPPDRLEERVLDLAAELGTRVTVIASDGTVLADSHHDPRTMDNHRFRAEIDAAIRDGTGSSSRFSATLGRDLIYFAKLVRADGEPLAVVRTAVPLSGGERRAAALLRAIGLTAAVSIALTLAVLFAVARRLAGALAGLTAAVSRFALGDFRRAPPPRAAEVAPLAESLGDMAERLGRRIARLQAQRTEQDAILESMSNGMIALDLEQRVLSINRAAEKILGLNGVAPRGRLLQELVREPELNRFVEQAIEEGARTKGELHLRGHGGRTVEAVSEPLLDAEEHRVGLLVLINDVTQLRRLETIRSEFAANVSHELRTPITNIKGYVETMVDVGCADEKRTQDFLAVIGRNADRLEAIVDDLLSLAELEQTEAPARIERAPVRIAPLIESVLGTFAAAIREKEIAVRWSAPPDLVVPGSRQLLEQAIGNLVSNAVNYSGTGTTVTVAGAIRDDGLAEITVADEGPGIPARHLPRIFERFYRVDRARSRKLGGTGLGLAIVKHIALVHGGRAEVESEVGRGSRFRLVLPLE